MFLIGVGLKKRLSKRLRTGGAVQASDTKAHRLRSRLQREPFLREIVLRRDLIASPNEYPFSVPFIRALRRISLDTAITFVVGESGSGKSTLLEGLAVALRLNPEGGSRNLRFQSRLSHSTLWQYLRIVRTSRPMRDTFFLRSETLYNLETALEDSSLSALHNYGNRSLHERSHGESSLAIVMNRLSEGVYIFDEPEAGLSPTGQLAFLLEMRRLVERGSQLILSTHSPILLAYPGATIYELRRGRIERRDYEDTDHYRVASSFFEKRAAALEHLFRTDET